jgi:hypothetical protein
MTGPKRLWSGDWMAESAAARARMADRRGIVTGPEDEPTDEHEVVRAPSRRTARETLLAALAAIRAAWRRRGRSPRGPRVRGRPRRLQARLIVIAVLAAVTGAAAMVSVEAATGAGGSGSPPQLGGGSRAYLGVDIGTPLLGQPGALVEAVVPGSPAARAGVMAGDVIRSVAGVSVTSPQAAVVAIGAHRPGAVVVLGLDRIGQPMRLRVTLGTRPSGIP